MFKLLIAVWSYKVKRIYKLNASKNKQTIKSKLTSLAYCDKCFFLMLNQQLQCEHGSDW